MKTKILVVDDNSSDIKQLTYHLKNEGYDVCVGFNGKQALELTRGNKPDLILLDVMIPEINGIEVCRSLKSDTELRDIPIIMITARSLDEDVIEGLDAGAHDYIIKPFEWPIVAARIRSAVRVKHAFDTLDCMNQQLSKAKLDAEEATLAKSQFLANMSHEIRTPMTAILGFSENLLEENISKSVPRDAVNTIHRNGEYLLNLINDILDLSKIESGKMALERINYPTCRIIAEIASLMRARAIHKNLKFIVEYKGPIPETIQTDSTRLRQILINLIGNAIKFTSVGTIRLITQLASDMNNPTIEFDVIDTGIGLTHKQASRLFQSFVQADNTVTRKFGGTGLGLTISKRFAQMLGGDIRIVTSEPGVGTHFRCSVNAGSLENVKMLNDPMSATIVKKDSKNRFADSKQLSCRILLAEDGLDNQRLITHVLKKAGASVEIVEDGKNAVDTILRSRAGGTPIDLVLMDMQMPIMDGYEATHSLRAKGFDGPIIALTAHAMVGDRDKCLKAGCNDYIPKPIDRKKLVRSISSLLNEPVAV